MAKDDGEPPVVNQDEDYEKERAEIASDMQEYFESLTESEKKAVEVAVSAKVVPIRADIEPQHTETELVPMTHADILFEKLVFDPEAELKAAAFEAWILDDLLPAKGIAFIYGKPGSYKSFIALDMALSISSGRPWHGYECEMPGAVIYIAAEGSRGILERSIAWKLHHECELGQFAVLPLPVMFDEVVMVRAFTDCMERAAEKLGGPIRLVVIDTMARSFNGDENSAQEVGAFVNACSRFSADIGDCLVLVVTHTGKEEARGIRGSSALDGAADCHFLVTKPNEGQALVKNTKQKDVEKAEPMRFTMEVVSTGIVDRKGRIRRSLVPILESKGEDADPDADEITVFDHKDSNVLCGMVLGAARDGKKITEDELRKEFIAYVMSAGNKKEDAAKKAWQRTYRRVRDKGGIMKAGMYLYPPADKEGR